MWGLFRLSQSISTHSLTRRLTQVGGRKLLIMLLFQLTASQGGWRSSGNCIDEPLIISTHSLTRRLTSLWERSELIIPFQLTASQGGWLGAVADSAAVPNISTHSLTRRLTSHPLVPLFRQWHFNSQPHKEADGLPMLRSLRMLIFQLTASQGGWPTWHHRTEELKAFQLTASQGGWRHRKDHEQGHDGHFNSQPHKEADVKAQSLTKTLMTFQLTASQGGWHRRDDPVLPLPAISTHSLTRRLTALMECMILTILISTHSLTRRLTWQVRFWSKCRNYFNSQPHKEADCKNGSW